MMNPAHNYLTVHEGWLQPHREEALQTELPIVDAHHHFYDQPGWRNLADDYLADTRSGHAICAWSTCRH